MRHVSRHWNDGPIEGLYAEACSLRGTVLSRLAAVGCDIDDLPRAEAIVNANIGELIATPEWAMLLDRPGGTDRILMLLVQSSAARINTKIRPKPKKRRKAEDRDAVRRPPLRLVVENGSRLGN
jgi:hypothetical protein